MTQTVVGEIEVIARALILTPGGVLVARQRGKRWSFLPGGHVEAGENAADPLIREIREEIGVDLPVEAIGQAGVVENAYTEDGVRHHEFNVVFTATVGTDQLHSREDHLEFHVVPLAEFEDLELRPAALHGSLTSWLRSRTPFFAPLPATAS